MKQLCKVEWYQKTNNNCYKNKPCSWCRGDAEKERFHQSAATHSEAGEKKTLNIHVVGINQLMGSDDLPKLCVQPDLKNRMENPRIPSWHI